MKDTRTTSPKPPLWSQRDLEYLRTEFPRRPTAEVAAHLGRSYQATAVKASLLGLKKQRYGITWTPQMLTMLRTLFPITFDTSLALCLRVSKRSLIRKARELGLEKEPGFLEKRRDEIRARQSAALKRSPNVRTRFKKGEHRNPEGEFKKGHRETPEQRDRRVAAYKATVRRRRQQAQFRKDYNINVNQ